jgi:carbon-monoxide dehydrogenase catalytic subunit
VVGCTNPRVKHDWVHVELVKELIKNDVLVVQTRCSQIALAKAGLYKPEAAYLAGPGLREVCEAVGMPPDLGVGSCVDNSRILIALAEMVRVGGLGDSIVELPVAGAEPEWMSEKAIFMGHYFVGSGVYTVLGVTFPIIEEIKFHKLLFDGLEGMGFGKWRFAEDPHEMARMMIAHIEKGRKALGIDTARGGSFSIWQHAANWRQSRGILVGYPGNKDRAANFMEKGHRFSNERNLCPRKKPIVVIRE